MLNILVCVCGGGGVMFKTCVKMGISVFFYHVFLIIKWDFSTIDVIYVGHLSRHDSILVILQL